MQTKHSERVNDTLFESQSEALAYLSHELRTPLNAILGYSELILAEPYGPLQPSVYKEYVEAIKLGGDHMLALVNDVLDYAKVSTGKMELNEQKIDFSFLFSDCIKLVSGMSLQKEIGLSYQIEENFPLFWGDEGLLRQAILNLLSNALKYTKKGGKVTLSAGLSSESVEVSVEDTGIGMSEEDAVKVLQPFAQVNTIENRSLKGTGLGLPLVKSFAELHGGSLVVKSEKNKGSKFTLVLPGNRAILA